MRILACSFLVAALSACATTSTGSEVADDGTLRFGGAVQVIDNGCFADGVCSVTVDGIKIVTLVGWSQDTWGQRDPELRQGQAAEVYCRKTPEGCTLNGSADYFVRAKR